MDTRGFNVIDGGKSELSRLSSNNIDNGIYSVKIYSDGACKGNPGVGGFGTIVIVNADEFWIDRISSPLNNPYKTKITDENIVEIIISSGYKKTTNNRMELMGVIAGFRALNHFCIPGIKVNVISDSQYVCKPFTERWIYTWIKNNWMNSSGELKNKDFWITLLDLASNFIPYFTWVKGHSVTEYNNKCDILAVNACENSNLKEDDEYERSV